MKYPKFLEGLDGYLHWTAPDGTEITKTLNDEGITAYWRKTQPEVNDDRIMMKYEEIVKYGLDKRGIMCYFANGDMAYGNKILEKICKNPDQTVEYKVHEYRRKF